MNAFAVQDVDAILEYGFDWTSWLSEGSALHSSEWSGPDGITLSNDTIEDGAITMVRVTVSDKDLRGKVYITNHVVSDDGQEDDRVLTILLKQGPGQS